MQTARKRLLLAFFNLRSPPPSRSISSLRPGGAASQLRGPSAAALPRGTLAAPWAAIQNRGVKVLGIDVRVGNVIQRKGHIYQVLKAQHTQQGRGGATIQVELRDVDSGNKITERFRTDEAIESVIVEDKSYTFLYQEGDTVTLMEPTTFEQLEVSSDLFGKSAAYLKDEMAVKVQFYDSKPMSASVPIRVTCTVREAQPHTKGQTATPQYKKILLDNGLTVQAPAFIKTGDEIIVNTLEDKYLTRAKEQ